MLRIYWRVVYRVNVSSSVGILAKLNLVFYRCTEKGAISHGALEFKKGERANAPCLGSPCSPTSEGALMYCKSVINTDALSLIQGVMLNYHPDALHVYSKCASLVGVM
jgi:hypothetical protein